jgi:hypothetical protein
MNPKKIYISLTAGSLMLALAASNASAVTVIYQDDFSGGAVGLNGTNPDTGANPWIAAPTFSANGAVADSIGASATLAFTPQNGFLYTLDASFRNFANAGSVDPDQDWIAVGFANGQSTGTGNGPRFAGTVVTNAVHGIAWSFVRGNTTATVENTAWLGTPADGSPTGGGIAWSDTALATTYASGLDLRVVLDTTGGTGTWNATWFAKAPASSDFTEVLGTTTLLSENINSVGIARSGQGFTADVTSFSLTAIPEPSAALLGGLGLLALLRRRR